jgi:hypothetical protein
LERLEKNAFDGTTENGRKLEEVGGSSRHLLELSLDVEESMLRLVGSLDGRARKIQILRETKNLDAVAVGSKSTWTTLKNMAVVLVGVNPTTNAILLLNDGDGSVEQIMKW